MSDVYFPRIIGDIGAAGIELTRLEATEGSAGNISVFVRTLRNLDEAFVLRGEMELPTAVADLAGSWVVVTGTGRRLRDISTHPDGNVVAVQIGEGGDRASWYAATELRPTSEWNSHLAIHADAVRRRSVDYHAVVHAQPHYLTYLSHHPAYATSAQLSDRVLRWEPETIVTFPEGLGVVPFQVPGSTAQMEATVAALREYRLVVWAKHGVVSRSDISASHAADLVEYGEMAARYEVLNLRLGSPAPGLTDDELRAVCVAFNVPYPPSLEKETVHG
jgi:rhamnulose-1-phosphate aldolase